MYNNILKQPVNPELLGHPVCIEYKYLNENRILGKVLMI